MKLVYKLYSVLFLSFALMGGAAAKEEVPDSIAGTTKVSAEQLIELLDEHDELVIIDARKASDRAKGYIEDSIALPDTETTAATLAEHVASKSTPVLFYCNGPKCGRSVKSSKFAVAEGYSKIYWFRGGWEEWTDKGYPIAK